jgi:hypothetical protein
MTADPPKVPLTPSGEALARRRAARSWLVVLISTAVWLAAPAAGREAAAGLLHLRCTNPASGARWPIVVDLDRSRVNSFAATITDRWISWRDPNSGFFDLERATGKLALRNASSTGGYFLHYQCGPER